MKAVTRIESTVAISCPSFALMEELRQLKGLRKLRLRVYGPSDQEISHLDEMIHERLVKLMAS